jgi:hypothetical protein
MFCVTATSAHSELIPQNRLTDWSPGVKSGVPGGIPNRTRLVNVAEAPYGADRTGALDAAPAIQRAINDAQPEDVIYIPPGTYRLDSQINISHGTDNVTIRGAGPNVTVLRPKQACIAFGASDGWNFPYPAVEATGGLSKGSTAITIKDATPFSVGALIQIAFRDQNDDAAIIAGAVPVFGVGGWDPTRSLRRQITRVVGKNDQTLTIHPAIYHSPDANLSGAKVSVALLQHDRVGIEDFAIDCADATAVFPILLQHAFGCWIKNVKVSNIANYGIGVMDSLQCEVRRCEIRDRRVGGSNGAALLVNTVSGSLLEDNILYNVFPLVEVNHGSSGNVFAYNLCENPSIAGVVYMGIDTNHGPHNAFNLYEGNVSPNLMADGYFGGCSEDAVYRNWFHGTCADGSAKTFTLSLKRFTRNYSLLGNVLGRSGLTQGAINYGEPNIGNGMSKGTAKPSQGTFWADWRATGTLNQRVSDSEGSLVLERGSIAAAQLFTIRWGDGSLYRTYTAQVDSASVINLTGGSGSPLPAQGTSVAIFMQPAGYQEMDLDVQTSTIEKGNFVFGNSGTGGTVSSLGADTLAPSLFRASKPHWFGDLAWPPFDPAFPSAAGYDRIPAGYRFIHGTNPPGITEGTPPKAPSNLKLLTE